jgi:predicted RNA-binding protein YlxR (DUF448 family)
VLAQPVDDETDNGPAETRTQRERLCLATGDIKPIDEMIRYVVAPDGIVVPDLANRLPGRGCWISANRDALNLAIERKLFARAFRGKGVADRSLADLVERLLLRLTLEALSIANKAGQVLTGFEKVKSALASGKISILVDARDAGSDGTKKLGAAVKPADSEAPAKIRLFSGEQLDLALGRTNVVHAALLGHPASRVFLSHCVKYERWRDKNAPAESTISLRQGN